MNARGSWALGTMLGAAAIGAGGCAHGKAEAAPPPASLTLAPAPAPAAALPPPQAEEAAEPVVRYDEIAAVPELSTAYFGFDSAEVDPAGGAVLKRNAEWLNAHEGVDIQVAGRCDPRGTVAYNLALGQRRAAAVRDYYMKLGVGGARIATISYGKEDPVCERPDEECWRLDRSAMSLKATPADAESVVASWPETARLTARVMIEKYGPPQERSASELRWAPTDPWKRIVVRRDSARPLEQAVVYAMTLDKVAETRKFGHGLSVGVEEGVLVARGDSEALNLLTLNLADEIMTGRMSAAQADRVYETTIALSEAGKSSRYMQRLLF